MDLTIKKNSEAYFSEWFSRPMDKSDVKILLDRITYWEEVMAAERKFFDNNPTAIMYYPPWEFSPQKDRRRKSNEK